MLKLPWVQMKKILFVDDNQEVQNAVKKSLEKDYEIKIVSTPEEAIDYNKEFDLLLTDFYFGEDKKRGLDVIKNWKAKKKDLSAILMSSGLNDNIKSMCKELNTPTFPKYENNITPINEDNLRELIKSYLR
jgi:DNA-binding NtrC family response regulator